MKKRFLVFVCLTGALIASATLPWTDEEYLDIIPHPNGGVPMSAVAAKLPYAYYPSENKLEVALAPSADQLKKAGELPPEAMVYIVSLPAGETVASGSIPIDSAGWGRGMMDLPDLPDGTYRVEYYIGKANFVSPVKLVRKHFAFETAELLDDHTVYPPFEPVRVDDRKVGIVERTYTMNEFGLFDSVVADGRELLAAPIEIRAIGEDGLLEWSGGTVAGESLYDDQAVFEASIESAAVKLSAHTEISEDGFAHVELTLLPVDDPQELRSLTIDIPLKDSEVPLCHFVGDNSMRHNYAGKTPRGGSIVWDLVTNPRCPVMWEALPGPQDGVIWDASQIKHRWNYSFGENAVDTRPFVPYIWLGDVRRGLAWAGESDQGYVTDDVQPVQQVIRQGDRVIIRVHLVQVPLKLSESRTIKFALQASPTKPMEPQWRTRPISTGLGPVVCWGGYTCSSKYPDGGNCDVVDKIQEVRRTGNQQWEWFEQRDRDRATPQRLIHYSKPWTNYVNAFVANAVYDFRKGGLPERSGIYFEEHVTDPELPEWEVFQDEWASIPFPRFNATPRYRHWGVSGASYRKFTLYWANEWLKRGVSLYFDNAYPKRTYNTFWTDAYTYREPVERSGAGSWYGFSSDTYQKREGRLRWAVTVFEQRKYYRQIWKMAQEHNRCEDTEYPVDVTFHMTNTQLLPMHTWCTATLDPEQEYRKAPDGSQLPFPPDYSQVISSGQQVGCIPIALYTLRGMTGNALKGSNDPRMMLSSWGMFRVHEIRDDGLNCDAYRKLVGDVYQPVWNSFYGQPGVTVHNYFSDEPLVGISDEQVKWIALTRENKGLLLLQSYSLKALTVKIRFPGAASFKDVETGNVLSGDEGIILPVEYGTRLFVVEMK